MVFASMVKIQSIFLPVNSGHFETTVNQFGKNFTASFDGTTSQTLDNYFY